MNYRSMFVMLLFLAIPAQSQLSLVPSPQEWQLKSQSFMPDTLVVLEFDKTQPALQTLTQTLRRDLADLGFSASTVPVVSGQASVIELTLADDPDVPQEGYRLTIDSDVVISAPTETGLFWGTRTLLQLFESGPGYSVPQLEIMDYPKFEYRSLLIDNARRFHSLEFHKEMVKKLAGFKLNRYHIHFSDNESYTLPSAAFPDLPTENRHFTRAQVDELVRTAKEYHVAIVPEIDVPGHSGTLNFKIPELLCTDAPRNELVKKICIGAESTYSTLETLFAEIMDMFPGEYWHLGADEVSYDNLECQACLQRLQQENLQDGGQLFHYFINRMHDFVKSRGRTMLVWEGFDPNGEPVIHKDILVCPFDVKWEGHMPHDYMDAGYRLLNTAWTPLYISSKIYMTTPEIMARWTPFMFGAGRAPQPFKYWQKYDPEEVGDKIIGAQMCSWENLEKAEMGLFFGTGPGFPDHGRPAPRLQIMAERVWSGNQVSAKALLERLGEAYW